MEGKINFDYWAMSLKKYLQETGDERQHDAEFINGRSDAASEAFEQSRLAGATVDQATEVAHQVLIEGFEDQ